MNARYFPAVASPPLLSFIAVLTRHLHGIFAHCRYPLSTDVFEGCNNGIKVLQRMAYGDRDDACSFLKIHAALLTTPG